MYESPIDVFISKMQMKLENEVLQAVQNVVINVDKDELIKALFYDRQQYEKGYADAKAEQQWIPVTERLPDKMGTYLVTLDYKEYGTSVMSLWFHNKEIGWDLRVADEVTAWMPLPEPYCGSEMVKGEDYAETD